jgi:hypothetical protein
VMPALREVWQGEAFEHHWWPERLGGRPHPVDAENATVGGSR